MGYKQIFNPLSGTFDSVLNTDSPAFTGTPTVPTQTPLDNSTNIASTQYVDDAVAAGGGTVTSYPILDAQSNTLIDTLDTSKSYNITYAIQRSVYGAEANTLRANVESMKWFGYSAASGTGINDFKKQSDGKFVIAGLFTSFNGRTIKQNLIRINADGTEDTAFTDNAVVSAGTNRFDLAINSVEIQSDGKILLGGSFTNYNATGKNRLIRLNSDGTEDTAFSANAVVSGTTPKFSGAVNKVVVQADGKILVVGNFLNYSATTGKHYLIRLNSDGTEDTAFSANAVVNGVTNRFNSSLNTVYVQGDGKILVGGGFTNWSSGTGKSYLIRFNSNGTEDTTFTTNAVLTGVTAKFNSNILSITTNGSGNVYVAGDFTNYNAQTGKNRILKFDSSGIEDTTFSTNTLSKVNSTVSSVSVNPAGGIVIGGAFIGYDSLYNYIVAINADGTTNSSFSSAITASGITGVGNPSGTAADVKSINFYDGSICLGGAFGSFFASDYFGRMTTLGVNNPLLESYIFGGLPTGTNGSAPKRVYSVAVQSDGKIIVGGNFKYYGVRRTSGIVRLNSDGTLDTTFTDTVNPSQTLFSIYAIAIQSDGKIIIGGDFSNYGGVTSLNNLIRLNSDLTPDTSFNSNLVTGGAANFNAIVIAIKIQGDGKIVVGGAFSNYAGQTGKSRLIRLNANGTEDTAFSANAVVSGTTPKFSAVIRCLDITSSGQIIAGGDFTAYNATTGKNYLIRLNSNGTEDTAFSATCVANGVSARFSATIQSIKVQSNQQILVGGNFTSWSGGIGKSYLMRFDSTGIEDTTFTTNSVLSSFSSFVYAIEEQLDGKILVGGNFVNYSGGAGDGTGKNYLIRLNSDGNEDTVFTSYFVRVPGASALSRFQGSTEVIRCIVAYGPKIFLGGTFFNYNLAPSEGVYGNYTSHFTMLEKEIKTQTGTFLATPTNSGIQFSTTTLVGPETDYPTGVTLSFNQDGTVKYSSTTLSNPSYAVDQIKIDKKQY